MLSLRGSIYSHDNRTDLSKNVYCQMIQNIIFMIFFRHVFYIVTIFCATTPSRIMGKKEQR